MDEYDDVLLSDDADTDTPIKPLGELGEDEVPADEVGFGGEDDEF